MAKRSDNTNSTLSPENKEKMNALLGQLQGSVTEGEKTEDDDLSAELEALSGQLVSKATKGAQKDFAPKFIALVHLMLDQHIKGKFMSQKKQQKLTTKILALISGKRLKRKEKTEDQKKVIEAFDEKALNTLSIEDLKASMKLAGVPVGGANGNNKKALVKRCVKAKADLK